MMVKGLKYKVKVADSFLNWTHGLTYTIEEIFIPEKKIAFNIAHDRLNAFRCEEPRDSKDLEEIELDDDFVRKLEEWVELREKLFKQAQKYFKTK